MNCDDVRPGLHVKTTELGETGGMLIAPKHLIVRATGVLGVVKGYVPGHGGDVWFIQHEGSSADVGAYCFNEFEPRQ